MKVMEKTIFFRNYIRHIVTVALLLLPFAASADIINCSCPYCHTNITVSVNRNTGEIIVNASISDYDGECVDTWGLTIGLECVECGTYINLDYIGAKPHYWASATHTDATCTSGGYDQHICQHCGTTERYNEVSALGHDFGANNICTRCGMGTCTLNETDGVSNLASEWSGHEVEFSFTRSFTQDVASTICLPYPMTGIPGGSVYEFRDVSYDASAYNGAGAWVATMSDATPGGNKADATEAGKPYLFMPSATGNVTFTGTVVVPQDVTAGTSTSSANDGTWTFRGTYSRLAYKADGSAQLSGSVFGFASSTNDVDNHTVNAGEFVKAKDGAGVPAFRAYLTYEGTNNTFRAAGRGGADDTSPYVPDRITVRLIGKDGTVTAVGTMDTVTGDVRIEQWFDLLGRPIDGTPQLPGIYINNRGRKVIIK